MFAELTHTWANSSIARHTFAIIPSWKPRRLPLTHLSTHAERTLLRCCFAHNDTRTSTHFGSNDRLITCRHCNNANETIDHLFLQCPSLSMQREQLQHYVPYDCTNPSKFLRLALLDRRYAIHSQRFIASALLDRTHSPSECHGR